MRICQHCSQERENTQFYPGKAKCKPCQAAYKRDLRKGITHPIVKPDVRLCRECQKPESEVEFTEANICKLCNSVYMHDYRKDNREKLSQQLMQWKKANYEHYRATENMRYNTPDGKAKHIARVEKTPRSWMSHLISALENHTKTPGPHDPKSGPRCDFDIDLDYVCELWAQQGGRCAFSKAPMLTEFCNLMSVSIDRIDNSKGHIKGNIQLVCQWVNFAKRHYSVPQFKAAFDLSIKEYLDAKN